MISASDFDWNDSEAVTIKEQLAVAVYPNTKGVIVVRQERAWDEDADTIILITPEHAATIACAILAAAGIDENEVKIAGLLQSPVSDRTAAERQRRYREKHRYGGDRNGVTLDHNGDRDAAPLLPSFDSTEG